MKWIEGSPGGSIDCSRHVVTGNKMIVAVSGGAAGFWSWDVYERIAPSPEDPQRFRRVGRCRALFTSRDDATRDAEYFVQGRTTVGGEFKEDVKAKRFGDGALVLKRKLNERISIGDDVKIIVVEICQEGSWVKIGIIAPSSILILREELVGIPKGV